MIMKNTDMNASNNFVKGCSSSEQAIVCFGIRTENKTHVLPSRM